MSTNRSGRLTAVLIIVFCAIAVSSRAGQDRWTSAGPEGGYITGIAADPSNPETIYTSTYGGGVFRSTDSGETWSPINNGLTSLIVAGVVVDRGEPGVVYARAYTDVLKSVDHGETWSSIFQAQGVRDLVLDPTDHLTAYVGTSDGVFRTTDGGQTWTRVSTGLPALGGFSFVIALALDPSKPSRLYAVMQNAIYKSDDRGGHWTFFNGVSQTATIAIDPSNSSTIYFGSLQTVSVTHDGGSSWTQSALDSNIQSLIIDAAHPDVVYVATNNGMYQSGDAGKTWQKITSVDEPVASLAIGPDSSTLYAGASGAGVLRSSDRGATWASKNSGLKAGYTTGIAMDANNPSLIYAGTGAGTYKSDDRGGHWALSDRSIRAAATISIDPGSPSTVYTGTYSNAAKTTNGGETWTAIRPNSSVAGTSGAVKFAIDPSHTSTVYAALADSGVSRSFDGGETWSLANDGLTLGYYGFYSLTVAVDPSNPSTVFASSGGVAKSTDSGAHWATSYAGLRDPTFGNPMTPNAIAIDPHNSAIVYATTYTGVYRSVDGGLNWTQSTAGLPSGSAADIAIDPSDTSTIYAAYGAGVYQSHDRGMTWSSFNAGLTTASVQSIIIDATGRFLAIGASNGVFTYDIVSKFAELQARELESPRLPELVEQLKSARSRSGFIVVPSGTVSGAGGAEFRSDISIVNSSAAPQRADLIWIPASFDDPRTFQITLPASSTTNVPGFVKLLGINGLGALLVVAVEENGNIDANASISGFSRIWATSPGNAGTLSTPVPAVKLDDILNHAAAAASGLRQDQNFRTNIGIVNLDSRPHMFTVNVGGERYTTRVSVDVPPLTMRQLPVPAGDYGFIYIAFQADGEFPWTAYASSVNSVTGENDLLPAQ